MRGRFGVLAWPVGLAGAVAVALAAIVGAVFVGEAGDSGVIGQLWTLAWVGFPLTGALIANRRPDTRIGWLLIGVGLAIAIGRFGAVGAHLVPSTEPLGALAYLARAAHAFEMVAFGLLALALLHFPTDRLPSHRWRIPAVVIAVAGVAYVVGVAFGPTLDVVPGELDSGQVANPLVVPVLGWLSWAGALLGFALPLVVLDLVRRAVRSRGVVRQQLKWLGYAGGLFLVALAVGIAAGALGLDLSWLVVVAFVLCFNGLAAAIGVAVLRYRLYDIDRVASRTVTYLVVSVVLVAAYVAAVVTLGRAAQLFTGETDSDLVVAASTLAVAALFGPLRRRIQTVVDRRFNRASYDAANTVADFSHRLRDELDLDAIADQLRGTAVSTVQPTTAGVWIRQA